MLMHIAARGWVLSVGIFYKGGPEHFRTLHGVQLGVSWVPTPPARQIVPLRIPHPRTP